MRRAVALLAAVLLLAGIAGCGEDGAEPGVPRGATVVLDFTPNAVHSGIFAAQGEGFYEEAGVDLEIRQPGESSDAPKLLAAGRTDFAILDIHDLGIARENGLDLVGVMPIVQRPLAAVIARADRGIARPRDLMGRTVGVTGLPSDKAVVYSEISGDGGLPNEVGFVTIGFNAVSALAAGKIDAVTGFWNAEGVALRRLGVPIRIFRVERSLAPAYPELILTTTRQTIESEPDLVSSVVSATRRGYSFVGAHPEKALDDLLAGDPALSRAEQRAQLKVLLPALDPRPFDAAILDEWMHWDLAFGLLEKEFDIGEAFQLEPGKSSR
jgi:NitT/TauT family transport system substrate-binding protein/putative hydroxymethylpyrimidine transport system substrate-binding protein